MLALSVAGFSAQCWLVGQRPVTWLWLCYLHNEHCHGSGSASGGSMEKHGETGRGKNAGHENWRFLGPNWFYDAQPKLGVWKLCSLGAMEPWDFGSSCWRCSQVLPMKLMVELWIAKGPGPRGRFAELSSWIWALNNRQRHIKWGFFDGNFK